jgi:hypothetical protein
VSWSNGQWYCDKCGYSHAVSDPCISVSSNGTQGVVTNPFREMEIQIIEFDNEVKQLRAENAELRNLVESWKGAHSVASVDRDIAQAQVVELRKLVGKAWIDSRYSEAMHADWIKQFPILKEKE